MKTKTTSNPGSLSRSLFTPLFAIAAACLSVGTAWTAHAQSDLFASINGTSHNGGGSIVRYAPDGTPSTFRPGLDRPRGLVFDNDGNLFVATTTFDHNISDYEGTIFKITPDGLMSTFATGFGAGFFLEGLALDNAGNVFVIAGNQNQTDPFLPSTIYKATPHGAVITFDAIPGPGVGFGLACDSAGNLFAANDQTIYKYTGGIRGVFVDGSANPPPFPQGQGPVGLAFDSSGNLFVSTEDGSVVVPQNGVILKFSPNYPSGMESTFFPGPTDDPLTNHPRGLAFDGAGNLFLADVPTDATGDILKFTPGDSPQKTTFASLIGPAQGNGGPEFLAFPPPNIPIAPNVTMAVTLTFPEGTGAETTTVTLNPSPSPTPSPSEFQLGDPPLAFDITAYPTPTTAPIIIAFQVPQSFLDQCGCDVSTLRVLHGTALEDVTCPIPNPGPTPDTTTNTVYASVSSLSPFVIAKLRYGAQVQQPINADGTSVFSVRRGVVPVKFTLTQDGVATCALPTATIALTRTSGGTTGVVDESVYSGSADTGSNFRISSCQYVYNLSSSALGVGTYRADIKINGTVVGNAIFQLK